MITIQNAHAHNLKNITLTFLKGRVIVLTGVSGSGKSSLAFDTLYREGERRYVESLSPNVRRYLGEMRRAECDSITGLTPTLSVEQKSVSSNPRSTVGTMTEIYDWLRLLFAKAATPHCPISGEALQPFSQEKIVALLKQDAEGVFFQLFAPVVKQKKGELKDVLEEWFRRGFTKARLDGQFIDLGAPQRLDEKKPHDLDVLIDQFRYSDSQKSRLEESTLLALDLGHGHLVVKRGEQEQTFSQFAYSRASQISYPPLEPHDFSFNSPLGMCPSCHGMGEIQQFDLELVLDVTKSIDEDPCTLATLYTTVRGRSIFNYLAERYQFSLKTPWKKLSPEVQQIYLFGTGDLWHKVPFERSSGKIWIEPIIWKGVINEAHDRFRAATSDGYKERLLQLMMTGPCPHCQGSRLKPYASAAKLNGLKIHEVAALEIDTLADYLNTLKLSSETGLIVQEVLEELKGRVKLLCHIGLGYLTLMRTAPTLSGGEAQRVRLSALVGSKLTGITYILDEPSIGLHPQDNEKLIEIYRRLSDLGNTVVVVEHDEETILAADQIIDIGPGPGQSGGRVLSSGTLDDLLASKESITAAFLTGKQRIPIPKKRIKPESWLHLERVHVRNLKFDSLKIPLNTLVGVTGVSGSGKSTLIGDVLYPAVLKKLEGKHEPGPLKDIGTVEKVVWVDQTPIGRTPRSNPATYIKLFDEIRTLFSSLPEAQARGFKPGRFSFNVREGSCPRCGGLGEVKVDLDFIEDAWVECPLCEGERFDESTLSVKYKDKSILDCLRMEVKEALIFFENIPAIRKKLEVLDAVGLEYLQLGQSSTTLSGGEAQRIKLAKELLRGRGGKTLYLLDEPTTGLHFADIAKLLPVLQQLVQAGNSVLVIEHNLELLKCADWLIDLGPGAGAKGGKIIGEGTPEKLSEKNTPTGIALRQLFAKLKKGDQPKALGKPLSKNNVINLPVSIIDAYQNNLKNISTSIPRNAITWVRGPSGSGKNSLVFDTLYAEGQRRYIETLSPYFRQHVKALPKPKVKEIQGLFPTIAIEHETMATTPRSTLGTLSEVYDYLRILFSSCGQPFDPISEVPLELLNQQKLLSGFSLCLKGRE
jgi:excinuclease ABC, A subunit